jgi:hypothetical protein
VPDRARRCLHELSSQTPVLPELLLGLLLDLPLDHLLKAGEAKEGTGGEARERGREKEGGRSSGLMSRVR